MIVSSFLVVLLALAVDSRTWSRRENLDVDGRVVFSWDADVGSQTLTIRVEAETKGVVAVGFSSDGLLTDADFAVGWVARGVASVLDMHARDREVILDERQDYQLLFGAENDTHTVLEFRRKFDTCDLRDWKVTNDTVRVMYAYQDEDPTDQNVAFHSEASKGQRSFYLLEQKTPRPPATPDISLWDVRLPNVPLVGEGTIYKCEIFKSPPSPTKRQVIGFEPLLTTRDRVHHALLYECHVSNSASVYEPFLMDGAHDCYTTAMPKVFTHCSTVVVAWGVGSDGDFTPTDVGFPLGEEFGGATYFMLEVHFELRYKQSTIDNSGLRLYLTNNVRANDASIINVGHVVSPLQIIPPEEKAFVSVSHCGSACTKQSLPADGINIFSVLLQAHSLATGMTLKHIRNGVELTPIVDEKKYDPTYLQSHRLRNNVKLLPGDHLMLECTYDTSSKNKTVVGGLNMDNEMCLVFIQYYPRAKLSECQSWPAIGLLTSWFDISLGQQINGFVVDASHQTSSKTLREFLERFRWSGRGLSYQREIRFGQYLPFCLLEGRFPANLSVTPEDYPQITFPHYVIDERCSVNSTGQSIQQSTASYAKVSDAKKTITVIVTSRTSSSDWLEGGTGEWTTPSSSPSPRPAQSRPQSVDVDSASGIVNVRFLVLTSLVTSLLTTLL